MEAPNGNDALACCQKRLNVPEEMLHFDTGGALQHLSTLAVDEPVVVGHGKDGVLCTGQGAGCLGRGPEVQINAQTPVDYAKDLTGVVGRAIGPLRAVKLVGCGVGGDRFGEGLVESLSKALRCKVSAPSCDVVCNDDGLWLDEVAEPCEWRTSPTTRPTPKPVVQPPIPQSATLMLRFGGQTEAVPVTDVNSVRYSPVPPGTITAMALPMVSLRVADVMRLIGFGAYRQLEHHGRFLSVVTGTLILDLKNRPPGQDKKGFAVLDWKHLEDVAEPDITYVIDKQLEQIVAASSP